MRDITEQSGAKLAAALAWAARGHRVFPLLPNSKVPALDEFQKESTRDPVKISFWWSVAPDGNIGCCPDDQVIVDLDEKDGRGGIANARALGVDIYATLAVRTPSGGLHLYYSGPPTANSAGRVGYGIDTRGPNGYVVAPGSTIDGIAYLVAVEAPIAPVPAVVLERLRAPRERAPDQTALLDLDMPSALALGRQLLQEATGAVAGEQSNALFRLAAELRDLALSEMAALDLLNDHYLPKCTPTIEFDSLRIRVENAYLYAQNQPGLRHPLADFAGVVPAPLHLASNSVELPVISFSPFSFAAFDGLPIPAREWIVQDLIPVGCVTSLYGNGGTGKSLLAQQLATACAAGREWIGLPVLRCPVFGLFAEDDRNELHRRQGGINGAMRVAFKELGDLHAEAPVGFDAALINFDRDGRGRTTTLYDAVLSAARSVNARLIILDPSAKLFAGDENNRVHVGQFIAALDRMALAINGAVLLTAHPSRSGMGVTGDGDGGSTAWSNAVRSRLLLSRPTPIGGVAVSETDANVRILSVRKSNYATIGRELSLRWHGGALRPQISGTSFEGIPPPDPVECVFLSLLDECAASGRHVSHLSSSAGNYAPKVFAKMPSRQGYSVVDFAKAMEVLFHKKLIRIGNYRKSGHGYNCIQRETGTHAHPLLSH